MVIQEYLPPAEPPARFEGPQVVVLSARTPEQLQQRAQQLLAWLDRHGDEPLADIAYTLQAGREAMEACLGMRVQDRPDLQQKLTAYLAGKADSVEDLHLGHAREHQQALAVFAHDESFAQTLAQWIARGQHGKLLQAWVHGVEVDWRLLHTGPTPPGASACPPIPLRARHTGSANRPGRRLPRLPPRQTRWRRWYRCMPCRASSPLPASFWGAAAAKAPSSCALCRLSGWLSARTCSRSASWVLADSTKSAGSPSFRPSRACSSAYSCTSTCAFAPPAPKAEIPATRGCSRPSIPGRSQADNCRCSTKGLLDHPL